MKAWLIRCEVVGEHDAWRIEWSACCQYHHAAIADVICATSMRTWMYEETTGCYLVATPTLWVLLPLFSNAVEWMVPRGTRKYVWKVIRKQARVPKASK